MLTLLDIVLRVSVVLGVTALVALAMRRASAAARHFVWTLGILGALVAPAATSVLPRISVPLVRVARADLVAVTAVPAEAGTLESRDRAALGAPRTAGSQPSRTTPAPFIRPSGMPLATTTPSWRPASVRNTLLLLWAIGAALILGRMLLGIAAVQWMSSRVADATNAPWFGSARAVAASMGVPGVRFLQSRTAAMPMAWGIGRPSVLMPAAASTWSEARLRVVLLHELAHVKRRDCLTHVLAQIACAGYWFHPLVWVAARRLRVERERACDDLVLSAGTSGCDYADELLDIARLTKATRFPAVLAGASLAMAHRSQLEGRLMAILDPSTPRRGVTRRRALVATLSFAAVILIVASVQPWAEARPLPSSQAPVVAAAPAVPDVQPPVAPAPHPEPQPVARPAARATDWDTDLAAAISQSVIAGVGGVANGVGGGVVDGVVNGVVEGVVGGVVGGINSRVDRAITQAARPTVAGADSKTHRADPRALEALAQALKDSDKDVRLVAAQALAQLHDPRAVEPLMGLLHDSDAEVREQAVFALGQFRDGRTMEPLIALLKDEAADVREQAAFALGQLRDGRAVEPLVIALKDASPDVREQAAFALGQLHDPRAIDGLTAALKDSSASVRQQAAFALGQIR